MPTYLHLIRLQGELVPEWARPQSVLVVHPQAAGLTLGRRALPARGWPYALLAWDLASYRALRWWIDFVVEAGEQAQDRVVEHVTLPDPLGGPISTTVQNGVTVQIDHHRDWYHGVVHRPTWAEDAAPIIGAERGTDYPWQTYLRGRAEVRITELGAS